MLGWPHRADVCHSPKKGPDRLAGARQDANRGADKKAGGFLPGRDPLSFLVARQLLFFFFNRGKAREWAPVALTLATPIGQTTPPRSCCPPLSGAGRARPAARCRVPHARRVALVPSCRPRANEWARCWRHLPPRARARRTSAPAWARAVPPARASPRHRAAATRSPSRRGDRPYPFGPGSRRSGRGRASSFRPGPNSSGPTCQAGGKHVHAPTAISKIAAASLHGRLRWATAVRCGGRAWTG